MPGPSRAKDRSLITCLPVSVLEFKKVRSRGLSLLPFAIFPFLGDWGGVLVGCGIVRIGWLREGAGSGRFPSYGVVFGCFRFSGPNVW